MAKKTNRKTMMAELETTGYSKSLNKKSNEDVQGILMLSRRGRTIPNKKGYKRNEKHRNLDPV